MEPTEKGFKAPTLDYFSQRVRPKRDAIVGVVNRGHYSYFLYTEDGNVYSAETPFPRDAITKVGINDLSGVSISFSDGVEYYANIGGNVGIRVTGEPVIGFEYGQVARVRKNDGTTVWENVDVPKRKRLLST